MTITLVTPVDGSPFGPGFAVTLSSDFVGPYETGTYWRIDIAPAADPENYVDFDTVPALSGTNFFVFKQHPLSTPVDIAFASHLLAHGDAMVARFTLNSPTVELDDVTIDVTWDAASGLPFILQQRLRTLPAATETTEQLELIDQAVHMSFPSVGRIPIGDFLGGALGGLAVRETITPDRSGEGTLDRPFLGVDVNAYGIEWEVVSAPAGNGVVQGAPDRWSRRVLDLQLVGTDVAANEYTRTYDSFHVDHYRLMFQGFGLTRLHYWIEPGITVRFYWLV